MGPASGNNRDSEHKDSIMKIDNNEYTDLSIAEKETLKHPGVARPLLFEPVAPRPLKKTRLERLDRLPLNEATTAMMRVVNYVSTPPLDANTIPELKTRAIPGSETEPSSKQVSR